MNREILFINTILCSIGIVLGRVALFHQMNFVAEQNRYAPEVVSQTPKPFSIENAMAISIETAKETCQNSFKWDRWNCPSSDFLLRSKSKSLLLDREDSYVKAITTASVLYRITKNCSSGIIAGCSSCSNSPHRSQCSDNPKLVEKLFKRYVSVDFPDNFNGKVAQHNYKAISNLLQKSLMQQCSCAVLGADGVCSKETCFQVLKPFAEIAADIRQMYDEGIQLNRSPVNSRIIWNNIPLDVLVYAKESPNYCEPDAITKWNGMRGRQCSTKTSGEILTEKERTRCRHLCSECGYTVLAQDVVAENRCNCKLTWGFQVQCETCVAVQKQYLCY